MATIYYKIFKHHRKKDGTYNIKYCLTHKGKQVYTASTHHVTDKQLIKSTLKLRDESVRDLVADDIKRMKKRLDLIGPDISGMDADEVLQSITKEIKVEQIDFIAFCRQHVTKLKDNGKLGTARSLQPVVNNLVDYFKSDSVPVEKIDSKMLRSFEDYMSRPRKQVRVNWTGEETTNLVDGVSKSGLHTTMRDLRVLFNACRKAFNTESITLISHRPFDFYTVPPAVKARKKGRDLSIADVKAISALQARKSSRLELAKDMFMLSFYLCGINLKDLYDQSWEVKDARITYGRSKTKDRRSDGAIISVNIPDLAKSLFERYTFRYLHNRYAAYEYLLKAVDIGMREVSERIGVVATFYHARHTFATLATNECGFDKADVARVLNHVDQNLKVTDLYIDYDWSVVDKVQAGVLALLPANDPV